MELNPSIEMATPLPDRPFHVDPATIVHARVAQYFRELPDNPEPLFPLVRRLTGEGVPTADSLRILGIDPASYHAWEVSQVGSAAS
ncbi:hypothetical protein GCM10027169_35970 [Gordonia jinhuaensis]|uniref:Uncharacterized protein n=1 Tax=Gordonia jinhuaensis TaxID=1517702 RepID=A0A916T5P9_9ACTN|nr:hypothetical protein [Gordonia jinhuaensis]GGB29595.1 hypothetical protein GCM10011489_17170 [Gordonia jinhuaensis]